MDMRKAKPAAASQELPDATLTCVEEPGVTSNGTQSQLTV